MGLGEEEGAAWVGGCQDGVMWLGWRRKSIFRQIRKNSLMNAWGGRCYRMGSCLKFNCSNKIFHPPSFRRPLGRQPTFFWAKKVGKNATPQTPGPACWNTDRRWSNPASTQVRDSSPPLPAEPPHTPSAAFQPPLPVTPTPPTAPRTAPDPQGDRMEFVWKASCFQDRNGF